MFDKVGMTPSEIAYCKASNAASTAWIDDFKTHMAMIDRHCREHRAEYDANGRSEKFLRILSENTKEHMDYILTMDDRYANAMSKAMKFLES